MLTLPPMEPMKTPFQSLSLRGQNKPPRSRGDGGILYFKHNNRTEYAIVQGRYTEKWSFPKGHSNDGETPLECSLREIAEEVGIDELPTPIEYLRIGHGNYYLFPLDHKVLLSPRDKHEVINTKWATIEEMEQLSLNVDVSKYVKRLKGRM